MKAYVSFGKDQRAIAYSSPKPNNKAIDYGHLWLDNGAIAHRVSTFRLMSISRSLNGPQALDYVVLMIYRGL